MIRPVIRPILLAAVVLAPAAAQAQDHGPDQGPNRHESHPERTFWMVRNQVDWSRPDGVDLWTWDADAWVGGDVNKLWLRSDGEIADGDVESASIEALYSRKVSTFWDVQVGVRHDFEPDGLNHLVAGVQGLAPYQFETEAFAYLSEDGDLGFRFEQALDLHLTQRLILEPEIEAEVQLQDAPERGLGSGLTSVGVSAQLRYEITRKFAPYVEVGYERLVGDTADLAAAAGEDDEETTLRVGLRTWF